MAAVSPQPVSVVPGQVVTQDPSSSTLPRNRRDSFQRLSAVPVVSKEGPEGTPKHGHHGQNLPCCLILYVSVLAVLCGFLVSGCHKAFVYSGCLLGINGCNSLNGYKYEKMGYILIKQFSEVPEEVIYILSSVTGAALCGLIIVCLPKHLQEQVKGGGTCQSLVAVATGKGVPLSAAVLRITLAVLFLMSGGSMGAEGPSIQVCTSFAMLAGWYSGIRAPVTQSLLASLGFSCGFAASFNAPLAGITFAMEELQHVSTRLTQATIYMIMVAAALSTAVARATAGNYQLFKPTWSTEDMMESIEGGSIDKILGEKMWMLIAVPIAVACSLCGYVISRCNCLLHRMFQKYRPVAPLPVAFALQALVTASLGALVFHVTGLRGVWGIGAESLQIAMTKTIPLGHLALFAVGKGVALVLGMAVRCPADLLEPVLITGGFVGGAIGSLLPQDSELLEHGTVMPCIIFGMVGLFASCFRFSLTPIVIVLEIVGTESYSLILPAVLCGFTASTCFLAGQRRPGSDVLFPALLEEVLVQDGIDLEELAAQAEETFEADDAAREREESEEESETASRWLERYGSTSAKSQKSKTSKSSVGDSEGSPGSPPAPSRQNSDAPLRFLRRGLEESLYQQSKAKAGTLRDLNGLLRSNSRHHRSPTMRHSLRKMTHESRGSTQEHALRVHESAGKLEVPLQGLRSPVDLRLALHEAIDDHGKRKYYLEVSNARAGSHPKDTLEYRGDLGCRSQSLLSIEERPNKSSNPAAASPAMDVQAVEKTELSEPMGEV